MKNLINKISTYHKDEDYVLMDKVYYISENYNYSEMPYEIYKNIDFTDYDSIEQALMSWINFLKKGRYFYDSETLPSDLKVEMLNAIDNKYKTMENLLFELVGKYIKAKVANNTQIKKLYLIEDSRISLLLLDGWEDSIRNYIVLDKQYNEVKDVLDLYTKHKGREWKKYL